MLSAAATAQQQCCSGGVFGIMSAGAAYTTALGALFVRKLTLGPHRTMRDFALDAARQVIGAACSDALTWFMWPLVSRIIERYIFTESSFSCETWQSGFALIDCTIGVGLQLVTIKYGLDNGLLDEDFASARYGKNIKTVKNRFLKQLAFWIFTILTARLVMLFGIVVVTYPLKFAWSAWTLAISAPLIFTALIRSVAHSVQFVLTDKKLAVSRDQREVVFEYDSRGPYVGLIDPTQAAVP